MKILVLNSGSSSVKYQMWDTGGKGRIAKGMISRIGLDQPLLEHTPTEGGKVKISPEGKIDHTQAIELALSALVDPDHGVIKSISEIEAVGHRVVHGGEEFSGSSYLDDNTIGALRACIPLAPLHNPANLMGIEACMEELPGIPQVGVFDTAFHQTMPKKAYLYGLPISMYEKHKIRRYGFHGTSHYYVAKKAAQLLDKPFSDLKIITAHLGNGASITAVDGGESVDTSMGFTPLEGLVMGTRCGDMDPYIPLFLQEHENMTADEVNTLLNKKSGLIGLTGISSDMRDILKAGERENKVALLAMEIYGYRVKKYIGAYSAAMGGLDALVFTAGVGENSDTIRGIITQDLEFMGIDIDPVKNHAAYGIPMDISTPKAKVRTLVIPTDEEFVIATETERIVEKRRQR